MKIDPTLLSTIILGVIGIGITAYYSWHSKKLAHEQLLKQLFTEFNERYNQLNDYLVEIENNYPTVELLEKAKNSTVLKQKVIDYFSLCAEEYFWFKHKKRIDPIIWNSWSAGMNYWYNKVPAIKALWEREVAGDGYRSYYITDKKNGFFKPEQQ